MVEQTATRMTQIRIRVIRVTCWPWFKAYGVTRKMPHNPLSNWKADCVRNR